MESKSKKKQAKLTTYLLHNTDVQDLNRTFYRGYDENFLFSKALALNYLAYELGDQQEHLKQQAKKMVGTDEDINDKFFAALRAELYFTAIHQFECLFALLLAVYQPSPAWFFLSEYEPGEMRKAAELFLKEEIGPLTGYKMSKYDFINHSVYSDFELQDNSEEKWSANIDNISWLLDRIAERYIEASARNVGEYNAYKHGLRVMTAGPSAISVQLQNPLDGSLVGQRHIVGASEDAFLFLQMEKDEQQNGTMVHEVIKHFSPRESLFFIVKMRQMLETMKLTRLARLNGENQVALNTFFDLDRNHVLSLRGDHTTFSVTI
jgi:hypothetical protein